MSKVYEALRQKEREISTDVEGYIPPCGESLEDVVSRRADSESGIPDRILEAALAIAAEEQGPQRESAPQFRAPSVSDLHSQVPPDGYRRLRLGEVENPRLIFRTDPHGLAAEQFRFLRRTLEQKFPKGAVLLITSAAPQDGKTLTTVNLCACLADSGRSTLLLEGDIRQPSIHKLLGGTNTAPGIEHVLAGKADPLEAIHHVEELMLHVAMVAAPPADPSHLVSGIGVKNLLAWARARFDWVVIDSPPVLPAADVTHFASLADATLLVVRAQSTPRDLVTRACELLGDHLFGVVLNEANLESNPYYRHLTAYRQSATVSSRRSFSKGNGDKTPPGSVVDLDRAPSKVQ